MKGFLALRNAQSIAEKKVPAFASADGLRQSVLDAVEDGLRLSAFFGRRLDDGRTRLYAILAEDREGRLWIGAADARTSFPSLTPDCPQAHLFEREIYEQFGVEPKGHPWLKPVRYPAGPADARPIPRGAPFYRVEGEEVHEVAVGPVHAGIIEPGHFRFQCHGEKVLHLEIQLGYQHRGVEPLLESAGRRQIPFLAESIAGDTSVAHGLACAMLLEALGESRVPARAQGLRALALELERLANHVGDLGALGADVGFLPAAAYFGRLRGEFLNLLLELTGSRYGRCFVRPGGVSDDLPDAMGASFLERLSRARRDLEDAAGLFFDTPSVFARLDGAGAVPRRACADLGLVGPAARACGEDRDVRKDFPFGFYRFCHIPSALSEDGDCFARAMVRWLETGRSLEFLADHIPRLPPGEISSGCGACEPGRLAVALVEGWRGEILHAAVSDERGKIVRYKAKDPSFHNWMGLAMALRNQPISDFPLINKSFNLSYAGHDL